MGRIAVICGIAACSLIIVGGLVLRPIYESGELMTTNCAVRVCLALPLLLVSLILADISSNKPSDSHTVKTLLIQYVTVRLLSILGFIMHKKFVKGSKTIKEVQENYLTELLKDCIDTDYGRRYNLGSIKSREDLVRVHPITEFNHYEDFVKRVCAGEENVMVNRPLDFIALSSGTTGKFKRFPIFTGQKEQFHINMSFITTYIYTKANTLRRHLVIRFKPKEMISEAGVRMGAISYYITPAPAYSIVPKGAAEITDEPIQAYIIALFALAEKDLEYLDCLLATICYTFFKRIEDSSEDLCRDLENGYLSDNIKVDDKVRFEINKTLKAEPQRANQVRCELRKGNEGLALRLWPNLKLVTMSTTGAFEAQSRMLKASFIKGVFCKAFGHIATEAPIGVSSESHLDSTENLQTYAFAHSNSFFEFIPEDELESQSPRTLFIDQLQLGQCYEIVLTNRNGLYRYRLGDVVKVVGFLHENPIYEFQYRAGQLLNVKTEKTSENIFYAALKAAEMEWKGLSIEDYTTTESTNVETLPGYKEYSSEKKYLLFVELRSQRSGDDESCFLQKDEQRLVDSKLREISKVYDTYRANGSIQCMEVIQVKPGTFSKLKAVAIKETNNQQYKTARANRKPELLSLLLGSRINDHKL